MRCADALRTAANERGTYDLVLLDPPYGFANGAKLAPHLARLLAPDGLVVWETAAKVQPAIDGLEARTSRKYGAARLTLFEH